MTYPLAIKLKMLHIVLREEVRDHGSRPFL
jgi:hypothetical protein